jgi:hypothetical protein
MSTRWLWSAVLSCALLVACAPMQPRVERVPQKTDCDGSKPCTVTVTVACDGFHGCTASVDYDIVVVAEKKKLDIDWQLAADPGFEFAANGIVLDNRDFDCKPQGKVKFKCTDTNSGFGVLKYTVNITAPSSAFGPRGVPSLDPWVVNR